MSTQLADNSMLLEFRSRCQALGSTLQGVPLGFWRTAVIALALFWACHNLAKLFWVVYPVPELEHPPSIAKPLVEESSGVTTNVNLELLQSINLNGSSAPAVDETAAAVVTDGADYSETTLSLKLQGIIASSQEDKGKAIIADGKGQAIYAVGEVMPQGRNVKLARVLHDKVILDNNGKPESLLLYSEEDFKGGGTVRTTRTSQRSPSRSSGGNSPPRELVERSVSPAQIAKAKSINDVVRFSLHQENNEVVGYRIRPGRDRALFEQLGLKTNDIVTSVNGVVINDRNQLREIYRTMRSAKDAQLEVNRDGSIVPITISLEGE